MGFTTNEVKTIFLSLILTAIAGISLTTAGQPPFGRGQGGPGGPGFGGPFARILNLTDEQKTQIKTLHEQEHTAVTTYLDQLKPLHEQKQKLIEATPFDENAVRVLEQQMAALQVEIQVVHAKTEAAIFQLLTPDQKAKLAETRQKMKELHPDGPPNGAPEGHRGGFGRPN